MSEVISTSPRIYSIGKGTHHTPQMPSVHYHDKLVSRNLWHGPSSSIDNCTKTSKLANTHWLKSFGDSITRPSHIPTPTPPSMYHHMALEHFCWSYACADNPPHVVSVLQRRTQLPLRYLHKFSWIRHSPPAASRTDQMDTLKCLQVWAFSWLLIMTGHTKKCSSSAVSANSIIVYKYVVLFSWFPVKKPNISKQHSPQLKGVISHNPQLNDTHTSASWSLAT